MKLYAEISKTEEQPDGTMKVWGYASSGAVDSDGETITPECMKAALPDYMKWGAVREMHNGNKAAGTAIEASVGEDGKTFFGAHVVDSEACLKLRTNVYKGFSIGGRVTERDDLNKTVIKAIKLVEVSLVDRPANPEAVFTVIKADLTPQDDVVELADMLDSGKVKPADLLALVKAAKAAPAKATETDAEKLAKDAAEKGMAHVAQLAYTLKSILYLVQDQMAEQAREGDASSVPAALQDWLSAGGEILKDMAAEEVSELTSPEAVSDYGDGQMLYMAERAMRIASRPESVAKAGAALSAKNKAHIGAIHDACKALGACDGTDKAAHSDDLTKAAGDLAKAQADLTTANEALAKAAAEVEPLKKRVAELEALPAPGKALLKAIGKTGDVADPAAPVVVEPAPVLTTFGELDPVATAIKAIHSRRIGA